MLVPVLSVTDTVEVAHTTYQGHPSAARAKLASVKERQRDLVDLRSRLEHLVDLCRDGDPGACASLDVLS